MITESDIERIAAKVAEETIRKFLLALGVATGDEKAVLALQADFAHLRQSRMAVIAVKSKALTVATGALVTGLIGAVMLYVTGKGH